MLRLIAVLLVLLISAQIYVLNAQSTGEIYGKVIDKDEDFPLEFAHIDLLRDGVIDKRTTSDDSGLFVFKPLDPGTYDLHISYTSYETIEIHNVLVISNDVTRIDCALEFATYSIGDNEKPITIIEYRIPLISPTETHTIGFTDKDLKDVPTRNVLDVIGGSAGVFQEDQGSDLIFRGSRIGSSLYMIDGIRSRNLDGVPISAIDQLLVYTGAIPAKYGDLTGGLVIVETKSYR